MQLHAVADRVVERVEHPGGGPGRRLGERLAFHVRRPRPVERAMRVGEHHPCALGQELGRRRHAVEQERRERLRALDEQSVGHARELVGEALRRLCGRSARTFAQGVVGDQLARRRHLGERHPLGGQLRRGHELADRLDLVAPVLHAHRAARRAGEDVDHAAPHGELAAVLDHVGPRVAEVDESFRERVGRQIEAGDELEGGRDAERRDQALHRREHRRDQHERALGLAHAGDGAGTPGRDLGRRRDALVRQGLPCREQRDPLGAEERLEVGRERFGLAGAGRHGEQGRLERGRHARDHEVLAGLGPGHDRPRTLEQEPLERLGTHEHIERVSQSQPRNLPNSDRTPRTGLAACRRGLGRSSLVPRDATPGAGQP